ncbi:MAG: hypothetical protein K0Q65_1625 [Clostridia bacterium]|nr:hypothetical protein [Clostridia bacterium]
MSAQKRFCDLLSEMLNECGKTHAAFYTELGIKKPYFYDILKGKANPPPPEKQFKIIKILNPKPEIREEFFELAAKERNEMPADLMCYIDRSMRKLLRKNQDYKDMMDSIIKGENEDGR